MSSVLECSHLEKKFGLTWALKDVSLSLPSGAIVGLLGPNGSGKTTLIKLAAGLLTPTRGSLTIKGIKPGVETKLITAYLPDKNYLNDWMKVTDIFDMFSDFYSNFNRQKAVDMLARLSINGGDRLKTMSKGTKEKVQLVLTMSREADLYLLDEPIGGVDPAARDFILNTIITNYQEHATVLISTHLINDVESILDYIVFLNRGTITREGSVDDIREKEHTSIDALFREEFKC